MRLAWMWLFWIGVGGTLCAADAIFPLAEVRPGMKATWQTVVRGNTVVEYELEILGVVPEGLGPGWSTVVGLATSPEMIEVGGVSGMSGSPVYIGGKLLGAYSYSYPWSRGQAFIGITPIEQMFKVLDSFDLGETPTHRGASTFSTPLALNGSAPAGLIDVAPQPVPAPLTFGGFSPSTVAAFTPQLRTLGWDGPLATGGGAALPGQGGAYPLEPGQSLAAVLMTGDFNAAATGTITWREGDRLLGFGHSFLGAGNVAVPLAGAEVVTIINNQRMSFKLSKFGDVVGTIFQDRASGVAGRIGPVPPMTDLSLRTSNEQGWHETYHAQLVQHPHWTSLLTAMTVMETASSAMSAGERQTLYLRGEIVPQGLPAIQFERVASGPDAGTQLAQRLFAEIEGLLDNPFEAVTLERIDLDLRIVDAWQLSALRGVSIYPERPRPGDEVRIGLNLLNYRGEEQALELRVRIPESAMRGDTYQLTIANGEELDANLDQQSRVVRNAADLVAAWKRERPPGQLFAALTQPTFGVALEGEALANLPPSVLTHLTAANPARIRQPVFNTVVDEATQSLPGIFLGSYSVPLTIR